MKAIGVTTYGGPEMLHELDVPAEPLGPQDVRLRVRASSVNPADIVYRVGDFDDKPVAAPPGVVPGLDAAGEVLEVGSEVETGVQVGDRVMAIVVASGPHGAYRSDLVVPARSVVAIPTGMAETQAATIPMNGLTARLLLDELQLSPGDVVVITGAAGALGGYAVQVAKNDGLTVVANAAEKDRELVESYGADLVVPRGDGFGAAVKQHYPDGVDGLLDTAIFDESTFELVKDGGRLASSRPVPHAEEQNRITAVNPTVSSYAQEWEKLDRLRQLVEDGKLKALDATVIPADQAADAHRKMEAGGVRGRLVLDFS